ncbi:MAG: FprA family A-type flavoprotein [Christensenellaceae bacterium]|jgi:flavorubredoxin
MKPVKIMQDIWWVGVQHPELRVFDVIMETKWGTSYNSYFVQGNEKNAVIDCVKDGFFDGQLSRLRELTDPEEIDYIVINHCEPDHTGALTQLMDVAKNATIVCSRPAKKLLEEITNRQFECIVVSDGDTIDLGGKTLRFIMAPFLHWPDTMFTYVEEDAFLSTCDAFGFHYSAPELFDDLSPLSDELVVSQKYYFDVIMSPFKSYVRDAVGKICGLDIKVIGPSHGPILRHDPWEAVNRYERWATEEENIPKKIYIGYVSCYGYTKKLAEKVFEGASAGSCEVEMEDISLIEPGEAAAKIRQADGFALGSPTLNRDALPPVWNVLTSCCAYWMKGKPAAVFGTYGWSGEACGYMANRLENLGTKVSGEARAKLNPNEDELKAAYDLGKALLAAVKAN